MSDIGAMLESKLPAQVRRNASIAEFTTYKLGGPVSVLVHADKVSDLASIASVLGDTPVLVIGEGSNILVSGNGFAGVGVHLGGEFANLEIGTDAVMAGAAVRLPVLARRSGAAGRTGLEFFVGIPGSVGGAVRMNAGGHGSQTSDVLIRAWCCDIRNGGQEREITRKDFEFGYRHSSLRPEQVVTRAEFRVVPDSPESCAARIGEIVTWRREHQPGGANAGSVFQNPPGTSAGKLIEESGCKGMRVGGAVVSEKHANFFQAEKEATPEDVYELILTVRDKVEAATGLRLDPEIKLVGFDSD